MTAYQYSFIYIEYHPLEPLFLERNNIMTDNISTAHMLFENNTNPYNPGLPDIRNNRSWHCVFIYHLVSLRTIPRITLEIFS